MVPILSLTYFIVQKVENALVFILAPKEAKVNKTPMGAKV